MTRIITGLSASDLLRVAMLQAILGASLLRAGVPESGGAAAPEGTTADYPPPAARTAERGTAITNLETAAAAAIAAAEEADKNARALEQSTDQALKEALSQPEEAAASGRKPVAGPSASGKGEPAAKGDTTRRGTEDVEQKTSLTKWETDRLRLIHSMAKSAAATAAADLQLVRIKYASAGQESSFSNPTVAGSVPESPKGDRLPASETAAAPGGTAIPHPASLPPPPLTLKETAAVCLGMSLLGAAGSGLGFWYLQRKGQRKGERGMRNRLADIQENLESLGQRVSTLSHLHSNPLPLSTPPQETLPPPAPALPAHVLLAMSTSVPLDEGRWREICQQSLRLLELIRSGWVMAEELPGGLGEFPAHQEVARRMLAHSRSLLADATGLTVWTVRLKDAIASGLLYDPQLPEFNSGGEDPEHHFRRRFVRDVLFREISPLLIVLEEMRHLNDFLPQLQGPDLNGQARRLQEIIGELRQRCHEDFGFEVEYVPLFSVCDFRTLKNTRNGDPARLPGYYHELNGDDKTVRGILRYGNQSSGLTPDTPTEIVYSP